MTQDVNTVESSPAAVQTPPPASEAPVKSPKTWLMPREGPERDAFLHEGTMPEEKQAKTEPKTEEVKPKADSTPAKEPDTVPAAEHGKDKQAVRAERPKTTAETRIPELLADKKRLEARIKELETTPKPASEPTRPASKPAEAPKLPQFTKPKPLFENYPDAEKFYDALTDWKIEKSDFDKALNSAIEKGNREIAEMKVKAREKYGEDIFPKISDTYTRLTQEPLVSFAKVLVDESEFPADLLYVLGPEMDSFMELAKTKPGQATRKLILLEEGIREELAKPKVSRETQGETKRGEDGKFVKAEEVPADTTEESVKPPAKKITQAPPPPMEAGGTKAAPPDDLAAVYERINSGTAKAADFALAISLENKREIESRRNGKR